MKGLDASVAIAVSLISLMVSPALPADAKNGQRLAFRWCHPCHVEAEVQCTPTGKGPAFAELADREDLSTGKLVKFLVIAHANMREISLTGSELSDVAAYINSLAKTR